MHSRIWRSVAAAASVAVLTVMGPAADAEVVDVAAWMQYQQIVSEQLPDAETRLSPGDNITCDPEPVVDGRMVSPRAPVIVGEAYAQVELAGHFKCFSLDRNMYWWLDARVTDMYWRNGVYQSGAAVWDFCSSMAGVCTVNPAGVVQYAGGHDALNTWHYAHFEAWTSTGRYISWFSPLFYVAGV